MHRFSDVGRSYCFPRPLPPAGQQQHLAAGHIFLELEHDRLIVHRQAAAGHSHFAVVRSHLAVADHRDSVGRHSRPVGRIDLAARTGRSAEHTD